MAHENRSCIQGSYFRAIISGSASSLRPFARLHIGRVEVDERKILTQCYSGSRNRMLNLSRRRTRRGGYVVYAAASHAGMKCARAKRSKVQHSRRPAYVALSLRALSTEPTAVLEGRPLLPGRAKPQLLIFTTDGSCDPDRSTSPTFTPCQAATIEVRHFMPESPSSLKIYPVL